MFSRVRCHLPEKIFDLVVVGTSLAALKNYGKFQNTVMFGKTILCSIHSCQTENKFEVSTEIIHWIINFVYQEDSC